PIKAWDQHKPSGEEEKKDAEDPGNESGNPTERKDSEVPSTEEPRINQEKDDYINITNNINTASDGNGINNVGAEADINNLDAFMPESCSEWDLKERVTKGKVVYTGFFLQPQEKQFADKKEWKS
ncbi:hypothetical protein Tco_0552004, partial [Tanacetum coccineum]